MHLSRGSRGTFEFTVRARETGSTEYASGHVKRCTLPLPADGNIAQIADRCQSRVVTFDEVHRTAQETFFEFGPRWRNLKAIHIGEHEALAHLELPAQFRDDVLACQLHPALLDLATGAALYLVEHYDQSRSVYFPISYRRATFFRPLPASFHSFIRNRERNVAGRDVASFDLTLLDEKGRVLS